MGTPFEGQSSAAGHVDDREGRIDLPGRAGNFPAIQPARQVDVGDKRQVFDLVASQARDGFLAGDRDHGSEPAIGEGFFDDDLDVLIVLDDQDLWQFVHRPIPVPMACFAASPGTLRRRAGIGFAGNVQR